MKRGFAKMQAVVAALLNAGASLIAGTDTPNPFVIPGAALHEELQVLVDKCPRVIPVLLLTFDGDSLRLGICPLAGRALPPFKTTPADPGSKGHRFDEVTDDGLLPDLDLDFAATASKTLPRRDDRLRWCDPPRA